MPITAAVEKCFEIAGASSQLLVEWGARESRTFSGDATNSLGGGSIRACIVQWVYECAKMLRMPANSHLQAATLLDAYMGKASHRPALDTLPAVVSALVSILFKLNTAEIAVRGFHFHLAENASILAMRLRAQGCAVQDATERCIQAAELRIFSSLVGQLTAQPTAAWLEKFLARFSILSANRLQSQMASLWQSSFFHASRLLQTVPASSGLPPSTASKGLITLSFADGGLLSAEDLRPREMDAEEWLRLLSGHPCAAPTSRPPPPGSRDVILQLLSDATAAPIEEVLEACVRVVSALS